MALLGHKGRPEELGDELRAAVRPRGRRAFRAVLRGTGLPRSDAATKGPDRGLLPRAFEKTVLSVHCDRRGGGEAGQDSVTIRMAWWPD